MCLWQCFLNTSLALLRRSRDTSREAKVAKEHFFLGYLEEINQQSNEMVWCYKSMKHSRNQLGWSWRAQTWINFLIVQVAQTMAADMFHQTCINQVVCLSSWNYIFSWYVGNYLILLLVWIYLVRICYQNKVFKEHLFPRLIGIS